ncbi:hypothetical protein, partial [Campylobacter jejuni]|uniref:hypothetical protein n=1 Tax=Campylobacter jejuni TaxID=197 RepID=UPI001F091FB0
NQLVGFEAVVVLSEVFGIHIFPPFFMVLMQAAMDYMTRTRGASPGPLANPDSGVDFENAMLATLTACST